MDSSVISMEMLTILLVAVGLAGLILTSQSKLESRLTKQNRDLEERLTRQNQEVREDVLLLASKLDGLMERVARMESKFEVFGKFLCWNGPRTMPKEED